jgi:uncharacterized protein (DUF2249 family)
MTPYLKIRFILLLLISAPGYLFSQQIADTTYAPDIQHPAYHPGEGPVVFIDEGHHNFHTMNGRYRPFALLLERDGYVVMPYEGEFRKRALNKGKILVISNALNEVNSAGWYLPTPSAFTASEIGILKTWVKEGGSLFLIADHMPLAGAAQDLAAQFGFGFTNGFAIDTVDQGPDYFSIQDGTLTESTLTIGRDSSETVSQVVSFTGQGFRIPKCATPVLTLNSNFINLVPDTAWIFDQSTRIHDLGGWSQGAFKTYGKGKIVVFGEAAMFSAQLAGPNQVRAGMNSDFAEENHQLLLNIIHWLDGKLD